LRRNPRFSKEVPKSAEKIFPLHQALNEVEEEEKMQPRSDEEEKSATDRTKLII